MDIIASLGLVLGLELTRIDGLLYSSNVVCITAGGMIYTCKEVRN